MSLFIVGGLIFCESNSFIGFIRVDKGKISAIGPMDQLPEMDGHQMIHLTASHRVIPGMIDVHIHGVSGVDVMDATPEAIRTMAKQLPVEGTTSFLATTITQESSQITHALQNAARYIADENHEGAECLGIHLEGPFISAKRAGAQPEEHILSPDVEQFQKWQQVADGQIRLVTLAPEQKDGLTLIRYLQETGVIASIGHSDATYRQVVEAIQHGASHITHLFNGMTGIHHRDLGVAGAALLRDELMIELIADGIHVSKEMIQLVYDQVTRERLILITDSMRAKCLKNGVYDLGGQQVAVKNGEARLADGTLAGSVLKMSDAFTNIYRYTKCTIEDLIQMTAMNAAKELGVDAHKGSIALGKDADLVILDADLKIEKTMCKGNIAYERGI